MTMKRRTFLKGVAAVLASPASIAGAQQRRASTLRFVPQANLTLLDPVFTSAAVSKNHGWAIYDTLFGITNAQDFTPQMAEGYTVSEDERTCLISLREGLKFHNGEPVRAQDCAASRKRWAARDSIGQTAAEFVDDWGVRDDRTIRIRLRQPLPIFMELIGKGGATVPVIMPESIARTDPFKAVTETIGSGPFKFVRSEYVPGSRVVYEKNTDYLPRQEPAEWTSGGKVVHFDRVEWQIIPDASTAAAALQAGEVDWYEQVQPDLVPLLRADPNITLGSANPTGYNAIIRFNHLYPPFDNVEIRRAVMMAVNQADYMTALTGDDRTAFRTCKAMLPCGTPYGRELGEAFMPADLDKARKVIQAAGYKGEKVVLLHPVDFPTIAPLDEVTNDLLRKLGMNVEMITSDFGTVTQRRANRAPPDKGGWSVIDNWSPSNTLASPVEQLYIRGLGDAGWAGWFKDDRIEQLTRQWLLARTPAERHALADQVQMRAFETVPMVPLGQFQIRTARNKNLVGQIEANGAYFWNIRRV